MSSVTRQELLYEGKAKKLYATDDPARVIMYFKDDATAYNAQKRGTVVDKGVRNNEISSILMTLVESRGVRTHFLEKLSDREQLCRAVDIVPLEIIVRNRAAGTMATRLGIEEGTRLAATVFELSYKNDALGDPLINDTHAVAIGLATFDELAEIYGMTRIVNMTLTEAMAEVGIELIDFKLEFGRARGHAEAPGTAADKTDEAKTSASGGDRAQRPGARAAEGELLLADEISADTCRFWDLETGERLDKDRFRRDLGRVEEAYQEIADRLRGRT
ncbi:MAG: phosphoribosylaminoimidazolesuccinocarboxamide synthase [bacterium]